MDKQAYPLGSLLAGIKILKSKEGGYLEIESLASVYQEIARKTDVGIAIEMYDLFKGQQIIFPQRLYNQDFVCTYIAENYNGHNVRELSKMFGYSDRRIRQIIKEKIT